MVRAGGIQLVCSGLFWLVLANLWHVLLLKQFLDAPELVVGRVVVAFGLALICGRLARLRRPGERSAIDRAWGAMGRSEFVLLGLFLALLFVFHISYVRASGDGREYFVQLRSLVMDWDLHLGSDSPFGADSPEAFPFGSAILWVPFYVACHLWLGVLNLAGSDFLREGSRNPYQMAVGLGTLTYGFAGVVLVHRIVRDYYTEVTALGATLAVSLGSFIVWYLAIDGSYTHGNSLFAVTLFVFVWHRTRETRTPAQWALLGVLGGVLTMVRWQNAVFVAIPIVDQAPAYWAAVRRRGAAAVALVASQAWFGLGGLIGFFPQLYFWKVANGGWLALPQGQSGQQWWQNSLMVDVLFSSNHGLFAWHPILYLATLGIPLFWRRDARLGALLTVMFLAQIYINGAVTTWWGGSAFGARRFASCAVLFALGLAAMARWLIVRPAVGVALIVASLVGFNLALVRDVRSGQLPSDEGITFGRMIERLGNPFSFPASAVFIWRYGGTAATYDRLGERMFNDVRIDMGAPGDKRFLGRGWSGPEGRVGSTFRWAEGPESVVIVPLYGPRFVGVDEEQRLADYTLHLTAEPFRWPDAPMQEIEVLVNGQQIGRFGLQPGPTEYTLAVRHTLLSRNLNEIRFRYAYARSPRELGLSDDPRRLAVRFDRIDFVQR